MSYRKLEDLEKVGIIQRHLSLYTSPIVKVPLECPPVSPVQESMRLRVNYKTLYAQMATLLKNKSSVAITLIDIPKIDETLACLCESKFFTN